MLGSAETATNRSQRKDYSVRVTHKVNGEIAVLRDQVHLIPEQLKITTEQIAANQMELYTKHNQRVEPRVAERTADVETARQTPSKPHDLLGPSAWHKPQTAS
jgi:hypothetical protein